MLWQTRTRPAPVHDEAHHGFDALIPVLRERVANQCQIAPSEPRKKRNGLIGFVVEKLHLD